MNGEPMPVSLAQWLEQTQVALVVRESLWGFQITVALHILGMILSAGLVVWLDLRLIGVSMRRVPVSVVYRHLMPWAIAGFLVMFVTGSMLFAAYAGRALDNAYFRFKAAALVLAGVNALVYHTTIERRIVDWDTQGQPPRAARLAGLFSIILWASVIFAGRMTAYTLY
jgi:hypothetical protein